MSKKELQESILRVFSLRPHWFQPTDSYAGVFLLPDDVADAFRGNRI